MAFWDNMKKNENGTYSVSGNGAAGGGKAVEKESKLTVSLKKLESLNGSDNKLVVNIKKSSDNLKACAVDLKKKSSIDMLNHKARVAVVIDHSGSMIGDFRDGTVQRTLQSLVPLALAFDDNAEMEVWLFWDKKFRDEGFVEAPAMTLENLSDYVNEELATWDKSKFWGCTEYHHVIDDVMRHYFEDASNMSDDPVFVIFITDGNPSDVKLTKNSIRESSKKNIFIQFIGIGGSKFDVLESLDDLGGRSIDNTGFMAMRNLKDLNETELYTEMLGQYVKWLEDKVKLGI